MRMALHATSGLTKPLRHFKQASRIQAYLCHVWADHAPQIPRRSPHRACVAVKRQLTGFDRLLILEHIDHVVITMVRFTGVAPGVAACFRWPSVLAAELARTPPRGPPWLPRRPSGAAPSALSPVPKRIQVAPPAATLARADPPWRPLHSHRHSAQTRAMRP